MCFVAHCHLQASQARVVSYCGHCPGCLSFAVSHQSLAGEGVGVEPLGTGAKCLAGWGPCVAGHRCASHSFFKGGLDQAESGQLAQ